MATNAGSSRALMPSSFAENLREALGKVPVAGLPRISRMRPGRTRFTVTDPNGNSVIFIKIGEEDEEAAQAYTRPGQTRLLCALHAAARLRDYKLDDAAAAKVLDRSAAGHAVCGALTLLSRLNARACASP